MIREKWPMVYFPYMGTDPQYGEMGALNAKKSLKTFRERYTN